MDKLKERLKEQEKIFVGILQENCSYCKCAPDGIVICETCYRKLYRDYQGGGDISYNCDICNKYICKKCVVNICHNYYCDKCKEKPLSNCKTCVTRKNKQDEQFAERQKYLIQQIKLLNC